MDALIGENTFTIAHGDLRLELEIVRIESLSLHERVISTAAEDLAQKLRRLLHLENPVIVEKNSIVLDGNHRAHVLGELGFAYIPVCRIDYLHPGTKLRFWFRRFKNLKDGALVRNVVAELRGTYQEVENRESLEEALEAQCTCCGVQLADSFAVIRFGQEVHDAVTAYNAVETIQERLMREGLKLEYVPCRGTQDTCECPEPGEAVLWTPRITKEMVVNAAKRAQRFAPKSTRHLVPARPLNIDVPIRWLRGEHPLEAVNRKFLASLQNKEITHLPPGQVIHGRYFEEDLFVFRETKNPAPDDRT